MNTVKRFVGFRGFQLLSILLLLLGACGSLATAQEASESAGVPSNSIAVTPSPSNILGSAGGVASAPDAPSRFPASMPVPSPKSAPALTEDTSAVTNARAKNLELIGFGKRLLPGATTDIWVHRGYAYLGTSIHPVEMAQGATAPEFGSSTLASRRIRPRFLPSTPTGGTGSTI